MVEQHTSKWTGSLRIAPYLIGFIFLASATTLSLAVVSAIEVYKAPIDASLWSYGLDHRWSLGWHIAYFTTAPLVSTVHSCLDLLLFVISPTARALDPTYATIGSAILTVGWVMQLVYWFQCDFLLGASSSSQCQQFYLVQDNRVTSSMIEKVVGVDGSVTTARVALGCMILVLYFGYFLIAGTAVYRSKAGRRRVEKEMEDDLHPAYGKAKSTKNVSAAAFYA